MKKITILTVFILATTLIFAQDFDINFTASGEKSSVDSVRVYNLSKEEGITINGDDILNLQPTGIETLNAEDYNISLYPNPANGNSKFTFENHSEGKTSIRLYDASGRLVTEKKELLEKGMHIYNISGLSTGIYMIRLNISEKQYSTKLSINSGIESSPQITRSTSSQSGQNLKKAAQERETIQMNFDFQEYVRFTAYSDGLITRRVIKPTADKTLNFKFHDCTDYNGNYYPAVQIGDQVWTGENLKSTEDAGGNSITRICYNNEASNCNTFGGLYSWNTIMSGASSTDNNPSNVQGICPDGWHLPSDSEWKELEIEMGMKQADADLEGGNRGIDEGCELAGNDELWDSGFLVNDDAFATSGFKALPAGKTFTGGETAKNQKAFFWTTTEHNSTDGIIRKIERNFTKVARSNNAKEYGLSVRCIKD